jgi:glycerophosphoryl diester phosphodiesterase
MRIPFSVEKLFHQIVDMFYEKWPQPIPAEERLRGCKIISHRGEHDNITVFENTLKAFDAAENCGVWGIEFDIRWTKDLHPVVFHDKDLWRIFGSSVEISHSTRSELRKSFPAVPWLEEVVERYGKKMHLMAEIKKERYPDPASQTRRLLQIFSGLIPGADYHFLSLDPAMFRYVDFVPNSTCMAVSQLNAGEMSRIAIDSGYQGIAGHYLFITGRVVERHKANRQAIGTGYIRSRNSLFRELSRGVDWIFSNDAKKLQQILEDVIGNAHSGAHRRR